ncbi:hypothetical protein ERO13_A11G247151v2 [Gossypium hirsutum]|nr:hypothetical protein ERO13_A11G247151v2 [Gossypium hirsutum]
MPHRTRPMTALLVFTGLNAVLVSTITPVYDLFASFLSGRDGRWRQQWRAGSRLRGRKMDEDNRGKKREK